MARGKGKGKARKQSLPSTKTPSAVKITPLCHDDQQSIALLLKP